MNIQSLFKLGMKRDVPEPMDAPRGLAINLGAGLSHIEGVFSLDHPRWDAESYHIEITRDMLAQFQLNDPSARHPIPQAGEMLIGAPDNSIACIHAYHFLEHLHNPLRMLMEINRVLIPGGLVNICVPHYSGSMAHQDLDHKHTFALETWGNALRCKYYTKDRQGWRLRIHFNIMMAIAERNTCILTQLVKE
jgi:SAM-dependent methyltransferase